MTTYLPEDDIITVEFEPVEFEGLFAANYSNGRLPSSQLINIGGGIYLQRNAGAAWLALQSASQKKYGRKIHVSDGYRVLGSQGDLNRGRWSQWAAWERYRRGGNLAAYPGTSNHGYGVAVDMASSQRYMLDNLGAKYGWAKKWSDAPSEPWHIKYRSGVWNGKVPHSDPTLRYRMAGPSVVTLKKLLWDNGIREFSSTPDGRPSNNRYNRYFGSYTKTAVQRFQRRNGLSPDGVVGPSTWKKLRS